MKLSTAYNHCERAIRQLAEVYGQASRYGLPQDEVSERRVKVLRTISHCPEWVKSYVAGWERATSWHVTRGQVFFYTLADNRLVSVDRQRDDYYEKAGVNVRELDNLATHSGYYWIIDGKPKPYFVRPMREEKEV